MSKEDKIQEIIESLSRIQRPGVHNARRSLGLSRAQMGMLFMLFCHENTSVKQVASYLGVTQSAITQLLDPLIAKSLVTRSPDPKDRRIARLSITNKGRALLKKFKKQKTAGLRAALNSLSPSDLIDFAKICRQMTP